MGAENSVRTLDKSLKVRAKQQHFIAAYKESRSVAAACRVAKCPRKAFDAWMLRTPEFRAEIDAINEALTDELEQVANQAAKRGDTNMLKFLLAARRKKYSPKISHDVDMSVEINVTKRFEERDATRTIEGGPLFDGVPPASDAAGKESDPT